MATSLAEQLKRLRTPQTTLLLQDKRKPSLLFDTKEAANLDRDTVYNIGLSGLEELVKLCDTFEEFKSTLFAIGSINLERSVQDQKANVKLDIEINRFLVLLSPYFLLNIAHKALEWLINRYHIHQYNKDAYMLLILPYHESRIFVRALQLLDISEPNDKWHWISPIQKTRNPLPALSVVNQAARDNGFLKLMCEHIVYATKVYGEQANTLTTLYGFYTCVVAGCIRHSPVVNDVQFNHILPALLKGLSSEITEFAASSFIIFGEAVTKIKIREETLNSLIMKSIKKPVLQQEVMILTLFLYDNPHNSLTEVSEKIMLRLANRSWFVENIMKIKRSGVDISKFIIPLLNSAFSYITQHADSDDSSEAKTMVEEIFNRVTFEEDEILLILHKTLADVSEDKSEEAKEFFVNLFQSAEKKYPIAFDKYLNELMRLKECDEQANKIFKFFLSWYSKAGISLNIFTGLNHYNPAQRIMAIEKLGEDNIVIPDDFKELVNKSLLARFNDDDHDVIIALLNLPIRFLESTFDQDTLVDELITLVLRCHSKNTRPLATSALKVLLKLCDESDDINVFLVTVPFLFPMNNKEVSTARLILESDFAKRNPYFRKVAEEVGSSNDKENVRLVAFHNILISELLPPASNILAAVKQQMAHGDAASVFFNMIILGSVCRVPVGTLDHQIAKEAVEIAAEMMKTFPSVKPLKDASHINADHLQSALRYVSEGHLPLQVSTYVLEMVHRRLNLNVKTVFDFEDRSEETHLMVRVLEVVFDSMHLHNWRTNYTDWTQHYEWYMKIFFQRHFKSIEETIKFLSQFFVKPVKPSTSYKALQICSTLLDNCKTFQWAFEDTTFVANLLLALSSEIDVCREAAVDILDKLSHTFNLSMKGYSGLLMELKESSQELAMDSNQLSLHLYTLLSPDPDVNAQLKAELRPKMKQARDLLFKAILSDAMPTHLRSQLLDVLVFVNGPAILKSLMPLCKKMLAKVEAGKPFAQKAIGNILQRFDNSSVEALSDKAIWQFFMECVANHKTQIATNDGAVKQYVNVIVLKQVDNTFFAKLGEISRHLQKEFLEKLVDIVTDCEIDSILSVSTRLVKKIQIDAQLIVDELKLMSTLDEEAAALDSKRGSTRPRKSMTRRRSNYSPELVNSRKWRRGVTLLEFIQHSNNIENEELLIPVLFDLLKTCLCFEEPVEYTYQLILSTIYHLTTRSLPAAALKDADAYVDLTAQCIRTSRNPQTHHHALLVLVELFKLADDIQGALQNIMPIFTFMGNSVLRQDDAYSIQIVSKTIDTIVPIINSGDNVNHVCEILRLFITSLPDIPEHRRSPLFIRLLQLLDNYLHLYYLLTFESHVLSKRIEPAPEKELERLCFALDMSQEFPVKKVLGVCVQLVEFLREMPVDIQENDRSAIDRYKNNHIFDVKNNSAKHLRHYKYTIVRFLSSLLSSPDFVNRVAELSDSETDELEHTYNKLIVELMLYMQNTSRNAELHQGKPDGKYWRVMLHGLFDILDLVNNLLPNPSFIAGVAKLIQHDSLTIRRRALELLNARLAQKKFLDEDQDHLMTLIDPVTGILSGPHKYVNPEMELIQQTALITLKLLAKLLASDRPNDFKPILDLATELVNKREGPVLGSAVLCVAELCSSMKAYAIQSLNKFVPAVLELLDKHCIQESPDILATSIISALQKIVESLGNFLSLYLDKLLYELARLSLLYSDTENQKIGPVAARLNATTQKLTSCLPLRILLKATNDTYDNLLTSKSYQYISPLMNIFAQSFVNVQMSDLTLAINNLANFFLKVLQFREEVQVNKNEMEVEGETTFQDVINVEESASNALIALIRKLSENTFRPLYYKMYDWAARNPQHKQRNITFYRLSAAIAVNLKVLFLIFIGHTLKHAASLLTGNNILNINDNEPLETTLPDEASRIELVEEILLTLQRALNYDENGYVNQERFETLMQPIVDQLENTAGGREAYEKRAKDLIVPCIASFAGAINDDTLHKQLVYQVLLKTRSSKSYVRSAALAAIVEIAQKLGEGFTILLPETVPFVAELLEDDDEVTERNAQNAVRTLEEILGEPMQEYF